MPKYSVSYYDANNDRVGEGEDIEAVDLSDALVYASNALKLLQGNAHVTSIVVEETE